jgi:hypothetical protein
LLLWLEDRGPLSLHWIQHIFVSPPLVWTCCSSQEFIIFLKIVMTSGNIPKCLKQSSSLNSNYIYYYMQIIQALQNFVRACNRCKNSWISFTSAHSSACNRLRTAIWSWINFYIGNFTFSKTMVQQVWLITRASLWQQKLLEHKFLNVISTVHENVPLTSCVNNNLFLPFEQTLPCFNDNIKVNTVLHLRQLVDYFKLKCVPNPLMLYVRR